MTLEQLIHMTKLETLSIETDDGFIDFDLVKEKNKLFKENAHYLNNRVVYMIPVDLFHLKVRLVEI